jgi:hypothetical protein
MRPCHHYEPREDEATKPANTDATADERPIGARYAPLLISLEAIPSSRLNRVREQLTDC